MVKLNKPCQETCTLPHDLITHGPEFKLMSSESLLMGLLRERSVLWGLKFFILQHVVFTHHKLSHFILVSLGQQEETETCTPRPMT